MGICVVRGHCLAQTMWLATYRDLTPNLFSEESGIVKKVSLNALICHMCLNAEPPPV